MCVRSTLLIIAILFGFVDCFAQESQDEARSPYVNEMSREIKALSVEQIRGFLDGEGMGFAKAAELNGFPGPRHVLDLAGELKLSKEQTDLVQSRFFSMNGDARRLGAQLVDAEKRLNELFSNGTVSEESMTNLLESVGSLTANIRVTHLKAHLTMMEILTGDQVEKYNELRGYGVSDDHDAEKHSGHKM